MNSLPIVYMWIFDLFGNSGISSRCQNEMHVKFLHDNLIQISFDLPGQGRRIDEFWVRVVTPKPKM